MSSRKVKSQHCDLGFLDRARHVPMTHTRLFLYSHHLSRSLHRCPRPAASLHRPSISMCLNLGEATWTSLLPTGILQRYGCLSRSIRVYNPMRSWDNLPALKCAGTSGTEAQGPLVVTNCGWHGVLNGFFGARNWSGGYILVSWGLGGGHMTQNGLAYMRNIGRSMHKRVI